MTVSISGTGGVTFNDSSVQDTAATGFGFKNRIINGAMVIDQRNAGASVTNVVSGLYTLDRWRMFGDQASKFTVQQNAGSVTPPSGYTNYLGATSSSAYSVGAAELFNVAQRIEGFNTADLAWGTAGAQTVTLSFWVRSSLTGTFGGALRNSAGNRSYPFSYTISTANTWEYETITISGDTSGTWIGATNGIGVLLNFSLGTGTTNSGTAGAWSGSDFFSVTGAVSVVGTNGATFYITGVQLEKGSTATSFDYRPYGTELALCQRYYQAAGGTGSAYPRILQNAYTAGAYIGQSFPYIVSMRATPTGAIVGAFTNQNTTAGANTINTSKDGFLLYTTAPSATVIAGLYPTDATGLITLSAEL